MALAAGSPKLISLCIASIVQPVGSQSLHPGGRDLDGPPAASERRTEHLDPPRCGPEQTGDAADHRGFARAVRTKQPEDFSGFSREAHAVHGHHVAVLLAERLHLDHERLSRWRGGGRARPYLIRTHPVGISEHAPTGGTETCAGGGFSRPNDHWPSDRHRQWGNTC